jgi:hypothetical protein
MKFTFLILLLALVSSNPGHAQRNQSAKEKLKVSENGRFLCFEDSTPFFWLGDTGWCLGFNLNREEAEHYLNVRKEQGFNVIQMMLMWKFPSVNVYGRIFNADFSDSGNIEEDESYSYWDHIDYIVDLAEKRGIYIAMLPTWGSVANKGLFTKEKAETYGKFLALRYKDKPNIIWVNGGDVDASVKLAIWNTLGETIKKYDTNHLMTFHPRGRSTSVTWFQKTSWLDIHMFQSGHVRYGQTFSPDKKYEGNYQEEDNWRFVEQGYAASPAKPILDGEPSYEDIPQGLRSGNEPRWSASDARRYAYWSVFSGACGHTYGNNAVMLMHKPGYRELYFNSRYWYDAIYDKGAQQMKHLKDLMLKFPYFDRVPDQTIIAAANGEKYDRIIATRGKDYLLAYTYDGCDLTLDLSKISGETKNVWWMKPETGEVTFAGTYNNGIQTFYPAGRYRIGNDWVLIAVDSNVSYLKK